MNESEKKSNLSELFKKVVSTGVSAAFMTEDALRNLLNDLPLPKETLNSLVNNAKTTKEEFIKSVKNELKNYLDKIDFSKEVDRIAQNYDFEINATVRLKKKKTKK